MSRPRHAIVAELWRRGSLGRVGGLHSSQREIHAQYYAAAGRLLQAADLEAEKEAASAAALAAVEQMEASA